LNVEYWSVGASTSAILPFTVEQVSAHLLNDWIPSVPAAVGSSFMGWPAFLLELLQVKGKDLMTLRSEVGGSERQWKSMLSWMLGVAGTRHVLSEEGYQWIAPMSAFYPEAQVPVTLSNWNSSFPRSSVSARAPSETQSRLRPDYVALRPAKGDGGVEWAVAESKGTSIALRTRLACPNSWYGQARHIEIAVDNNVLNVPRYLVIATRVNPNAKRQASRCLQIRAWNSDETSSRLSFPADAAADVASAHLFGVFRNIGLLDSATALAESVRARASRRAGGNAADLHGQLRRARDIADAELERFAFDERRSNIRPSVMVRLGTGLGDVEVEVDQAATSMAAELSLCVEPGDAAQVFRSWSHRFIEWQAEDRERDRTRGAVVLPSGVRVRFPQSFRDRR
jgi:hypothetical protein